MGEPLDAGRRDWPVCPSCKVLMMEWNHVSWRAFACMQPTCADMAPALRAADEPAETALSTLREAVREWANAKDAAINGSLSPRGGFNALFVAEEAAESRLRSLVEDR